MLTDLTALGASLATIAGVTNVVVNLLKAYLPILAGTDKKATDLKYITSILVAVVVTLCSGVSLFVAPHNDTLFWVGSVAAGIIAGLGSNFIHEILSVLQTIKSLKK